MILLESTDAGTMYIGGDNNYYVSFETPNDGFVVCPLELGPHVGWDELSRVEDWEECPF